MLPETTILVIDDEPNLLIGIRAILERAGYKTLTANKSLLGLQMAREHRPDLIICDVMMPKMDGFTLRENLNEDPDANSIPFLFLSARTSQTDKLRGLLSGADDYMTKPFDHRELLARISTILKRYQKGNDNLKKEVERQIGRIQKEVSHNLSHELRTPITQILLSLDIILRQKYENPEDLKLFVEIALSQSHRLNGLINDLIYLNNHDAGIFNILRQSINILDDFQDSIISRQELYKEKALQLQFEIAPDVVVHAPRHEFTQAVVHLVDNAFKFAPSSSQVLVNLMSNGVGGCILTVSDSGEGIPVQFREEVFDRYFQISQGYTRAFGGLGVGLTIARMISQSLGGDTKILDTQPGCTVQMVIPAGLIDAK